MSTMACLNNGGFNLAAANNPSAALPDLSEQQHALKGLAVVASSHQAIVADAVTLGLSIEPITGDALALVPVTNLMSGTTAAYIDSAKIDTRLTTAAAGELPEVYVGASSGPTAATLSSPPPARSVSPGRALRRRRGWSAPPTRI